MNLIRMEKDFPNGTCESHHRNGPCLQQSRGLIKESRASEKISGYLRESIAGNAGKMFLKLMSVIFQAQWPQAISLIVPEGILCSRQKMMFFSSSNQPVKGQSGRNRSGAFI